MTDAEKHRHRYEDLAAAYESRANSFEASGDEFSAEQFRNNAAYFRGEASWMSVLMGREQGNLELPDQPESD
jgi:hypothetical protein